MRYVRVLITSLFLFAGVASAQGIRPPGPPVSSPSSSESTSTGSIRGRVVLIDGSFVAQSVRITVQGLRGSQSIFFTDNQGQFDIRSLPTGDYTLEAEGDPTRFVTATQQVQVFRGMPSVVTITLREKADGRRSLATEDVISAGELGKDVPAKARKEFERASAASKEGKTQEAVEHLRNAISIYPNFLMAHNDLGAQLLDQGKLDEAEAEFRRAIEIDEKAFNPYLNLGIVLLRQQKFSIATETLKKALSLRSNSPAAKFYLGLALSAQHDLDGAEKELLAAHDLGGAQYAIALYHLGQIYMDKGERERALQAFETYLREVPDAANRAQVQKLIGMLR